jgi:hypothetical protein
MENVRVYTGFMHQPERKARRGAEREKKKKRHWDLSLAEKG